MDRKQAQIFVRAIKKLGGTGKIATVRVEKDKFFPQIQIGSMSKFHVYSDYELVLEFDYFSFLFVYDERVEAFIDVRKCELVIWDKQATPECTVTFKPILEEYVAGEDWLAFAKELEETKE